MPSAALLHWPNDRLPRLARLDVQCAACLAATPPDPTLIDENLRGFVVLLSAHFQGFCRDLHTECGQTIAQRVRSSLQSIIQEQFSTGRRLDHGNPSHENIRLDFSRFGAGIDLGSDPANLPRLTDLAALNRWRNVAAHQGTPSTPPLNLPSLRAWLRSCEGLAASLDAIMYNRLRTLLRRSPW